MRPSNVMIRIPQPCHESWENMQPVNNGRHCSSCEKTVIDFSGKSDREIADILYWNSGKSLCGRFISSQVGRPLVIQLDVRTVRASRNPYRVFAASLLLVFGASLVSCYDHQDQKINVEKVEVTEQTYESGTLLGEVDADQFNIVNPADEDLVVTGAKEFVKGKIKRSGQTSTPEVCVTDSVNTPVDSGNGDSMAVRVTREYYTMGAVAGVYMAEDSDNDHMNAIRDSLFFAAMQQRDESIDELPGETETLFVYPNPVSDQFTISYKLTAPTDVHIYLFDENGKLLNVLVDVTGQHRGRYRIPTSASGLKQGLYFVRMLIGETTVTKKIVVAR